MSWSQTFLGPFCRWPPCDCLLSGPLSLHCKTGRNSTSSGCWGPGRGLSTKLGSVHACAVHGRAGSLVVIAAEGDPCSSPGCLPRPHLLCRVTLWGQVPPNAHQMRTVSLQAPLHMWVALFPLRAKLKPWWHPGDSLKWEELREGTFASNPGSAVSLPWNSGFQTVFQSGPRFPLLENESSDTCHSRELQRRGSSHEVPHTGTHHIVQVGSHCLPHFRVSSFSELWSLISISSSAYPLPLPEQTRILDRSFLDSFLSLMPLPQPPKPSPRLCSRRLHPCTPLSPHSFLDCPWHCAGPCHHHLDSCGRLPAGPTSTGSLPTPSPHCSQCHSPPTHSFLAENPAVASWCF